jgi:NTP pyrophosphatase (non-canonical NTP hydrolase)
MYELKSIIEQANKLASEKGFWEDYDNMIKKMKGLSKHFTEDDIDRIKLAFYSEKISLISSELGEATEAMRIGKFYKGGDEGLKKLFDIAKNENAFQFHAAYSTHVKDTFEDEIADSFIRLCDMCQKMNIDIESFVRLKMEYNKLRDDKHGKRF